MKTERIKCAGCGEMRTWRGLQCLTTCSCIERPDVEEMNMTPDEQARTGWAIETMEMINKMTPDIKGKAFDPDWFLLRQRLEAAGRVIDSTRAVINPAWIEAGKGPHIDIP